MPESDQPSEVGNFPHSHTYDLRLHMGAHDADARAMSAKELADAIQTIVRELTPEELAESARYVETTTERS